MYGCINSCTTGIYYHAGSCIRSGGCTTTCGQGKGCSVDTDCGTGHCADGVCCDAPCAGACDRCDLAGRAGTCTLVAPLDPGASPACAPYVCDGTSPICPSGCRAAADCAPGYACMGGTCCRRVR